MEHGLDVVEPVDRVGQPGRAHEGEYFRRLADHGLGDRRIMEHGDAAFHAQRAQRVFQLAGFVQRLVDEGLDRRLAERAELAAAEAADEALDAGKADARNLDGLLAQHGDACRLDDARDFLGLAFLIIVVAEHGDDRDGAGGEILRQQLGLAGLAEIGEVAAQDEYVGRPGYLGEQRVETLLRRVADVQIADRGDRDRLSAWAHACPRCPCRRRRRSPIR